MKTILPYQYFVWLYYVSFAGVITTVYACYKKLYYTAIIAPGAVMITSINYWRRPDYSWRRYHDIVQVVYALFYQLSHLRLCTLYYIFLMASIWLFVKGVYHFKRRELGISTYYHFVFHLSSQVGNIILYRCN